MSDSFYADGGGADQGGGYDSGSAPTERKARDRSEQNLLPVTIRQIVDAEPQGEGFAINGKPVYQVRFVGAIREAIPHSTNLSLTIEDGTGQMKVKFWVDEAESDDTALERATWQ